MNADQVLSERPLYGSRPWLAPDDEGGPLPLTGAGDSAGDRWLYLTTLFIE